MASPSVREELLGELDRLSPEDRERVLRYARTLRTLPGPGTPGGELVRFSGVLSPEAADEMSAAIEEGCERIDVIEW